MSAMFSEVYGRYYAVVARMLREAPLSRARMEEIAREGGFGETPFELLPPLMAGAWPLFEERDGLYHSLLKWPPAMPLTALESRWLAAVMQDDKAVLFMSEEEKEKLLAALGHPQPLFRQQDVRCYDQALDGDDYASARMRHTFQQLKTAISQRRMVRIHYMGPRRGLHVQRVLPLKLEYSMRDDKFRLMAVWAQRAGVHRFRLLNLQRMEAVYLLERADTPIPLGDWLAGRRCEQPIELEASAARNTVERLMMEFSFCEKESVYDDDRQVCHVRIWYRREDETEMVIRLLGFGPTVRVLGPAHVVADMRRRALQQRALMRTRPEVD